MLINSHLEYEATILLIQEMSGAPENSPEERLLVRLARAVALWEVRDTRLGDLDDEWSPELTAAPQHH